MDHRGFALISALLLTILMTFLMVAIHLQTSAYSRMVTQVKGSLYSLNLAENGIEMAQAALPRVDIEQLLLGPDGSMEIEGSGWRDPWTFDSALHQPLDQWKPISDDGLLEPGGHVLPASDGAILLKFSNNPEEAPDQDRDGVVLARSMGIFPVKTPALLAAGVVNHVTLIEARLRQERALLPFGALTLLGNEGSFEWDGVHFRIDGNHQEAITLLANTGATLESDLHSSWTPIQGSRIQGSGKAPSVINRTDEFGQDPKRSDLFKAAYWSWFLKNLPGFAESISAQKPGKRAFSVTNGDLDGNYSGLVVTTGDTVFRGRVDGLLLHLGGGTLSFEGGATVRGGVWISSFQTREKDTQFSTVRMKMSGLSSIHYDETLLEEALALLPATLLGQRLIFPEMSQ